MSRESGSLRIHSEMLGTRLSVWFGGLILNQKSRIVGGELSTIIERLVVLNVVRHQKNEIVVRVGEDVRSRSSFFKGRTLVAKCIWVCFSINSRRSGEKLRTQHSLRRFIDRGVFDWSCFLGDDWKGIDGLLGGGIRRYLLGVCNSRCFFHY